MVESGPNSFMNPDLDPKPEARVSTTRTTRREKRGFGVSDGLIFIAATACGLASIRVAFPRFSLAFVRDARELQKGWSLSLVALMAYHVLLQALQPCLAAWTIAAAGLYWRRPRQIARQIIRQPGAIASHAAAITNLLIAVPAIVLVLLFGEPTDVYWSYMLAIINSTHAGAAIMWCWLSMALYSRWRSEPVWLDRLGRALGITWVGIAAAAVGIWYVLASTTDY